MKNRKKTKNLIFLMLLVCAVWCSSIHAHADITHSAVATKRNPNFTVQAKYGLDGLVYYSMPTMVLVDIESKENFSGSMYVVSADGTGALAAANGTDITLAAGEKKTYQISMNAIDHSGIVYIRILDDNEKIVYEQKNTISMASSNSKVTIGILSDDYSALQYWDRLDVMVDTEPGVTSIFELTKDTFPEDEMGISMLQYMIIDNYDTSQLSKKQYKALKNWVGNGGILILGLGSNYQSVLNVFQDSFLSGTVNSVEKMDIMYVPYESDQTISDQSTSDSVQPEYDSATQDTVVDGGEVVEDVEEGLTTDTDLEQAPESEEDIQDNTTLIVDCASFQLEGGEPLLAGITDHTIMVRKEKLGQVVVLGYSLAMEPFSSAPEKDMFATFILEQSMNEQVRMKFYGGDYDNSLSFNGLELAKSSNDTKTPSSFLYGLLLMVYVVVVGPVLYLVLKKKNKRERIWIAIPLVSVAFTLLIYLTGFIYRINKPIVSTTTVFELTEDNINEKVYANLLFPKTKKYQLQFTEQYTGFDNGGEYSDYSLFSNAKEKNDYAYLLKKNNLGTEFSIHCNEPFKDVGFILNGTEGGNEIGNIKQDLVVYTDGFDGSITNNTCYDLEDVMVSVGYRICYVGEVKKGETVNIDKEDAKVSYNEGSYKKLVKNTGYNTREYNRKYNASDLVETFLIQKNQINKGYVWAYIPSYEPDIVQEAKVKRYGNAILWQSFDSSYADEVQGYYFSIDDFISSSNDAYWDMETRMLDDAELVLDYSFEGCKPIKDLTVQEYNGDYSVAEIWALNVLEGKYEQIFMDSNTIMGEELKKYMIDNRITIKYVQTGQYTRSYIPYISAREDE